MEYFTQSAQDTQKLGREFGSHLTGGELIGLVGELGSGKTTFVQGLAQGLGVTQRIISPTFILLREYSIRRGDKFYHADLYRLGNVDRDVLVTLGIFDFAKVGKNVMVIEWAEKAKKYLPENTKWVTFQDVGENNRKVIVE